MNYIICNKDRQTFFLNLISEIKIKEKNLTFVSDKKKFTEIFSNLISFNGFVLIDVETKWENAESVSFYGFDIAADLRRLYKVRNQIIFFSTFTKEYFEKLSQSDLKFKLLYGRGSSYVRFSELTPDILKDKLLKTKTIGNAALYDVITMLCDLKGVVIDKLNHRLQFDSDVQEVISSIAPYLSNQQKHLIDLDNFVEIIKNKIITSDRRGFQNEKLKFITLCNQELTEEGKDKPRIKLEKYKVLLVDDVQDEIDKAKSFLEKDFTIIETTKGEEAIEILKKDIRNEIIAIISDWRLFTDEKQNYWQQLQGYEVLDFASKNGIRSLIALTSQADFVVHQLRNLLGIRFSLFKKENLNTTDQWQIFSNILFENCEQAIELRGLLPSSDNWKSKLNKNGAPIKSYMDQYIGIWNSNEKDSFFNKISLKANEVWDYLEKGNFNSRKLNLIGAEFGHVLSATKYKLEPVLILRRIWLALWFNLPDSNKKLLREDSVQRSEEISQLMFGNRNVTGNRFNLCLEEIDIKGKNIFPEESAWLIEKELIEVKLK